MKHLKPPVASPRLAENEAVLLQVYELLIEAAASNLRTAPASGWLLDNFYKVEEQIRIARHHHPKNYSRELSQITKGPLAGFPRVYDLARELILHTDGRVGYERISLGIANDRIDRNIADNWADQMISAAEKDPKSMIVVVANLAKSNPPMSRAFVAGSPANLRARVGH